MPRVGVVCAVDGAKVSDAECLQCRSGSPRAGRHCDFSYEMLAGMMSGGGAARAFAKISATMLTGPCARKTILESRAEYYSSPMQMFPAWRGGMGHKMTEASPQPGVIYENRFETVVEIDGQNIAITGQLDSLDIPAKKITDFKTKPDARVKGLREPDEAHVWQLNIYRYLVKYGWPQRGLVFNDRKYPPNAAAEIEVDNLFLVYWSMGSVVTLPAPVFSYEEVFAYISERAAAYLASLPEPGPGLNPEKSSLCVNWCGVQAACIKA